ncbi:GNAT family N-acetyltransferase [Halonotius pteroides]|uniref:GNAT family N-acetyltransferase n=1 Tax=Halonotius pteroides TaxID=268735 RepID=UPI00267E0A09|nr:GNAT family N-acetyltransferase [Halonotius pteroides]
MWECYRVPEPSDEIVTTANRRVETGSDAATDPTEIIDAGVDATTASPTDRGVGTLTAAFAIRRAVFVAEQGVDPSLEWDDAETEAIHLLLVVNDRPVGTARVRRIDDATIKAERVAVRRSARNAGWGRRLMDAVEAVGVDADASHCVLHAQRRVAAFYHKLGYQTVSDPFDEAGIPHVKMERALSTQ